DRIGSDADGGDGEGESGELWRWANHGPVLGLYVEHPEGVAAGPAVGVLDGAGDDDALAAADADGAGGAGLEARGGGADLAPPAARAEPLHHGGALDAPDAAADHDVGGGGRGADAVEAAPRARRRVEPLGVALEPALPRRAVPAHGEEPVAGDGRHPVALVPLLRHVRERVPRVRHGVVRLRRLERVLVLVVPARHVDPPAGLRAREEGPRRPHRRRAPPHAGGGVEHVDVRHGLERLGVPPAEHRQARPHRGALREHGHRRRRLLPPPLPRRHVVHRHPVRRGVRRRVAVLLRLLRGRRGRRGVRELEQVNQILVGARLGARHGERGRRRRAPPPAAHAPHRPVSPVRDARQAVDGDVVGHPRDELDVLDG
ncbi:Os11g0246166, partial [Oryza sativa Japonica Group]